MPLPLLFTQRVRSQLLTWRCHAVIEKGGCVVIIPGDDGRQNEGSQQLLKYLGLSSHGMYAIDPVVNTADEAAEDSFYVLSANSEGGMVFRRTDTPDVASLFPVALQLSLAPEEYDNIDAAELYKVGAFLRAIAAFRFVGLPLTPGRGGPREAEYWPLIQTHGLDEAGLGGFFTSVRAVSSIHAAVAPTLRHVDAGNLQAVAAGSVHSVLKHWADALHVLHKAPYRKRSGVTGETIGDALFSLHQFSAIGRPRVVEDRELAVDVEADLEEGMAGGRVLIGPDTAKFRDNADSSPAPLHDAKHGYASDKGAALPAFHAVAVAHDAASGVRCARTYFLRGTGPCVALPASGAEEEEEEEEEGKGTEEGGAAEAPAVTSPSKAFLPCSPWQETSAGAAHTEGQEMERLHALLHALHTLHRHLLGLAAKEYFVGMDLSALQQQLREAATAHAAAAVASEAGGAVAVDIEGADALSVRVPASGSGDAEDADPVTSAPSYRLLLYVRCAISGLSTEYVSPGAALGALVVGDTIAIAAGAAAEGNPLTGGETPMAVLTGQVPYIQFWVTSPKEVEFEDTVTRLLGNASHRRSALRIGEAVGQASSEECVVLGGKLVPYIHAGARVYERGLVLESPGIGHFVLSMEDVVSVAIVSASTLFKSCTATSGVDYGVQALHNMTWSNDRLKPMNEWWGMLDALPNEDTLASLHRHRHVLPTDGRMPDVLVIRLEKPGPRLSHSPHVHPSEYILIPTYEGSAFKAALATALGGWHQLLADKQSTTKDAIAQANPLQQPLSDAMITALLQGIAGFRAWQVDIGSTMEAVLLEDAALATGKRHTLEGYTVPLRQQEGSCLCARTPGPGASIVPVLLLTGPAGSGKTRLAKALSRLSSQRKLQALEDTTRGAGDLQSFLQLLTNAITSFSAPNASASGLVVVVPPAVSTADACAAVMHASQVRSDAVFGLWGAVACIHVASAVQGKRRQTFIPGLPAYCAPGYVSHILLTGLEDAPGREVDKVQGHLTRLCPDAQLIRAPGGSAGPLALSVAEMETLLQQTAMHCPAMATKRAVLHPRWAAATGSKSGPLAPFPCDNVHVVPVAGPVDRSRLTETLHSMLQSLLEVETPFYVDGSGNITKAAANPLGVTCRLVKARVQFTDDDTSTYLVHGIQPGKVRITKEEESKPDACECLIYGAAQAPDKASLGPLPPTQPLLALLSGAITACAPAVPEPLPKLSLETMPAGWKTALEQAAKSEPLPKGVYFDGSSYIDFEGHSSSVHPSAPATVQAALTAHNDAVMAWNASRDSVAAAVASGKVDAWKDIAPLTAQRFSVMRGPPAVASALADARTRGAPMDNTDVTAVGGPTAAVLKPLALREVGGAAYETHYTPRRDGSHAAPVSAAAFAAPRSGRKPLRAGDGDGDERPPAASREAQRPTGAQAVALQAMEGGGAGVGAGEGAGAGGSWE